MSYQGWRRGSPYERPGNNVNNQRRGRPRGSYNVSPSTRPPVDTSSPRQMHPTPSPVKSASTPPTPAEKKSPAPPKTDVIKVKAEEKETPAQPVKVTNTPVKTEMAKTSNTSSPAPAVSTPPPKTTNSASSNSNPPVKKPGPEANKPQVPKETKNPSPDKVIKSEPNTTNVTKPAKPAPTETKSEAKNGSVKPSASSNEKPSVQNPISRPEAPDNFNSDRAPRERDHGRDRQRSGPPPSHSSHGGYGSYGGHGHHGSNAHGNAHDRESHRREERNNAPLKEEEMETDARPEKLIDINDLIRPSEKKFSSRCRLFVAGLPNGCTEEEFCKLFQPYGETTEAYINKEKSFGFIRLDYRVNSEIARNKLDGSTFRGRRLQVRLASNASAIEVYGLGPFVTDEILEQAFSKFGAVERAIVVCDDRGKSKEYGIVEFSYKKATQKAIQSVNSGLFVLGKQPKPVSVKLLVTVDEESGVSEPDVERKPGYAEEREYGPRFVGPGTFEYELAQKWKALEETEKARKQEIENEIKLAKEELENEIASAMHMREEDRMRQELMKKEEEFRQLEEQKQMERMLLQEQLRRMEQKRLDEEQKRSEDLSRKQNELRAQGEMRKMQELQRQEDFRRHADMGRRPDDMRGQDDRRRPGDLRGRDDERRRPDDTRLQGISGMRSGDLRRMDDPKRKDAYRGDDDFRKDSKMDIPRGLGGRSQAEMFWGVPLNGGREDGR